MAVYFVASGGSNTSPYDTWAKAATSLQTALTAASTNGDIVAIQHDGVPAGDAEVAADTIWTFAANVSLIASTNSGTSTITPTAMGDANWLGRSTTTSYRITLSGAFSVYIYGCTFRVAGTTNQSIFVFGTDGAARYMESCTLWLGTTHATPKIQFVLSSAGTLNNLYSELSSCVFRFGNTSQSITPGSNILANFYNCSIHASSSTPSTLFASGSGGSIVNMENCDWSLAGSTIVGSSIDSGVKTFTFTNCKMPASFSWLATQSPTNMSANHVWVYNSGNGDDHYHFEYHNALGSCVSNTAIYASGGAKFDGTNGVSWQIDTTSACSDISPFITPWIDLYHSGTSAITPSLEICRSGSATAYDNDEVWGEFGYQGTSGQPLGVIVNDRMALAGTPAAQTTGSLGAGDWTGENATSWFGKLNTTSTITPAEIGMLRARVCVGLASATVYVDPYIRT